MKEILDYIRPNIRNLVPYSTARDEYKGEVGIFLDANENPYDNGVNRYPDPMQKRVRNLISELKNVDKERIFIGNGSDEAIDLCFRIFCEPGKSSAIAVSPSYGMYKVAAAVNDVEVREVLLNEDFSLPVDRLLAAADDTTRLMFVCSPNNPTGNAFPMEQLQELAESFNGILIVDEAYVDFSEKGSLLPVLESYSNLIVLQTLSKAWGMAGLRTGLAFASEQIISYFNRVKYPYNINVTAQRKAEEMLRRDISAQISRIKSERRRLQEALAGCRAVERVFPSDANFLLMRVKDAKKLYSQLLQAKVIVRDRSSQPMCSECLRVTVGTPEENERMLDIVKKYIP
ncbi:MAG: histidinol-phosphate transaminase [Bacteroidales bacterium]|nr:histidinol-phosphate transaminase [Candidatus Cacconaster equi]